MVTVGGDGVLLSLIVVISQCTYMYQIMKLYTLNVSSFLNYQL